MGGRGLEEPSICANRGLDEVTAASKKGAAECLANPSLRAASGDISITEYFLLSTLSEEAIVAVVPIEGLVWLTSTTRVSMIPDEGAIPRLLRLLP